MVPHSARNHDTAWTPYSFEPGSNIHTITEDIVALSNNIPNIHADAELHAPMVRQVGIAGYHCLLDGHRASDRVHDARKLREEAVTHHLKQPSLVVSDLWLDQVVAE